MSGKSFFGGRTSLELEKFRAGSRWFALVCPKNIYHFPIIIINDLRLQITRSLATRIRVSTGRRAKMSETATNATAPSDTTERNALKVR